MLTKARKGSKETYSQSDALAKAHHTEAGFPVYRRKAGGQNEVYLVHSSAGMWCVTDDPAGGTPFNCQPSNEVDVTQLQPKDWQVPRCITEICESKPDRASSLSIQYSVYIRSNTAAAKGIYTQLENDFDGYPAYVNEDSGMHLFHTQVDGCWHLGMEMDRNKALASWQSNTMDVSRLEES